MECVFFLINKIKNNKNEKVKIFTNVKLYGAKLNIVIAPNKKGATNTTKNLLFSNLVKLILVSFFQFYSFSGSRHH